MSNTNFVDGTTVIVASWANDVNDVVYEVLGDGTTAPTTKAQIKTNLSIDNVNNTSDANKPISTATQTALDLKVSKDSNTGAAAIPSGTTAQRPAGAVGLFRYNSDLGRFEGYAGSAWGSIGGGATGAGGDAVFIENDQTVTTDYTITSGKNAGTFGPVTIANGKTVTVPSGAVWSIV